MSISHIKLTGFRNLENTDLSFEGSEFFFVGDNAQGKTNILEALYFLCYGSSFKKNKESECIKNTETQSILEADFKEKFIEKVIIKLNTKQKQIFYDGKECKDRIELIEKHPCVVFCHSDMNFVIGSPEYKRWFFDQTLSLVSPMYLTILRDYKKILKIRNCILQENKLNLLEVITVQLAHKGIELQKKREEIIKEFNVVFTNKFNIISQLDKELKIEYISSWKQIENVEQVMSNMKKKEQVDITMKTTTSGPHRDKFIYKFDDKDFTSTASTGQCRLLSLLLRSAQADFYHKQRGKKPILLLDDVLLELDPPKRNKFIQIMPQYEQAFFTFLPGEHIRAYVKEQTMIYSVQNGQIKSTQSS